MVLSMANFLERRFGPLYESPTICPEEHDLVFRFDLPGCCWEGLARNRFDERTIFAPVFSLLQRSNYECRRMWRYRERFPAR